MSVRSRSVVALAVVVCASLVCLVFKGATEWVCDLLVSASAGVAGRLKSRGAATDAEPETDGREGPPRRRPRHHRRKPLRHAPVRHPARISLTKPKPLDSGLLPG